MSTYAEDRAEAEANWLETRIAAWQAARDDHEPDDGPYHYPEQFTGVSEP